MKKPPTSFGLRRVIQFHRCLISELFLDRSRDVYVVDVLRVDDSLNFANRTGTGSTVFMTKEQLAEALKLHGARTKNQLIGAPVKVKTTFETGNVLGSSAFYENTL